MSNNTSPDDINLENVSRTLLRIIAHLPKSKYHFSKSNGQNRRQADERQLTNLPNLYCLVSSSPKSTQLHRVLYMLGY